MGLIKIYGTTQFPIDWNCMKLTGYIKDVLLNIPTKFEGILKKLKFL